MTCFVTIPSPNKVQSNIKDSSTSWSAALNYTRAQYKGSSLSFVLLIQLFSAYHVLICNKTHHLECFAGVEPIQPHVTKQFIMLLLLQLHCELDVALFWLYIEINANDGKTSLSVWCDEAANVAEILTQRKLKSKI
jgi:hypothetical protein